MSEHTTKASARPHQEADTGKEPSDYQRRAQAAEKALAEAQTQLKVSREEKAFLAASLKAMEQDRAIDAELAKAGAADPEVAAILVRDRLGTMETTDLATVVAQLHKDKPYLFGDVRQEQAPVGHEADSNPRPNKFDRGTPFDHGSRMDSARSTDIQNIMPRSGGAKDRAVNGSVRLSQAAQRAAESGSRDDLLEYLRLRRHS